MFARSASTPGAAQTATRLSGHATFTVGGDDVDAPAGTLIHVRDPKAERIGVAKQEGTVVLSLGATAGTTYEPSGWDTSFLEGAGQ